MHNVSRPYSQHPFTPSGRVGLKATSLGATLGAVRMKQKMLGPALTSPRHQAALLSLDVNFIDLWFLYS